MINCYIRVSETEEKEYIRCYYQIDQSPSGQLVWSNLEWLITSECAAVDAVRDLTDPLAESDLECSVEPGEEDSLPDRTDSAL